MADRSRRPLWNTAQCAKSTFAMAPIYINAYMPYAEVSDIDKIVTFRIDFVTNVHLPG